MNQKAEQLANMPTNLAISMLKEEARPKGIIERDPSLRCGVEAGKEVVDDWGDSCEGSKCLLTKGHNGKHMATDGANGWVTYTDSITLNTKERWQRKEVNNQRKSFGTLLSQLLRAISNCL